MGIPSATIWLAFTRRYFGQNMELKFNVQIRDFVPGNGVEHVLAFSFASV